MEFCFTKLPLNKLLNIMDMIKSFYFMLEEINPQKIIIDINKTRIVITTTDPSWSSAPKHLRKLTLMEN